MSPSLHRGADRGPAQPAPGGGRPRAKGVSPRRRRAVTVGRGVAGVVTLAAALGVRPAARARRPLLHPAAARRAAGVVVDGHRAASCCATSRRAWCAPGSGSGWPSRSRSRSGAAIAWYRPVREFLTPVLEMFRNTAALAMLPVFTLILGIGETSKIAIVLYACFFPILLGDDHRRGDRRPAAAPVGARCSGSRPVATFRKVVFPAAVPDDLHRRPDLRRRRDPGPHRRRDDRRQRGPGLPHQLRPVQLPDPQDVRRDPHDLGPRPRRQLRPGRPRAPVLALASGLTTRPHSDQETTTMSHQHRPASSPSTPSSTTPATTRPRGATPTPPPSASTTSTSTSSRRSGRRRPSSTASSSPTARACGRRRRTGRPPTSSRSPGWPPSRRAPSASA